MVRNLTLIPVAWKQARPIELGRLRREEGQTVVEYALVVGLVSIVLIVTLGTLGSGIITKLQAKVDSFLP